MKFRSSFTALFGAILTLSLVLVAPTAQAAPSSKDGACIGNEGVTVVMDPVAFDPNAEPVVKCAIGAQSSGMDALVNSGFALEEVPGQAGAICKIDGYPASGFPTCWYDGYWSYWHADAGDTEWEYSNWGAGNRTPELGGVEGWRYVSLDGWNNEPPRVGPAFEAEEEDATLPAKKLTVKRSSSRVLAGKKVKVSASGLEAGEKYSISVSNQSVATGTASNKGTIARTITVPKTLKQAKRTIKVVGAEPNRAGSSNIWVAKSGKVSLKLKHKKVRAGYKQTATVKGLLPGEPVKVYFNGKRVSPKKAKANSKGVYKRKFVTKGKWGKKTVRVAGFHKVRKNAKKFHVTPRNGSRGGVRGR